MPLIHAARGERLSPCRPPGSQPFLPRAASHGSRQMVRHFRREGIRVGRHRVRRLMHLMGIQAIYRAPRTSKPHPGHRTYPYLPKGLKIEGKNQVWCADITYIPVRGGFLYFAAVLDWASRRALAWRLSNPLDASFCVEALEEALARHGGPEFSNTDEGSQFTSSDFTGRLEDAEVKISMDGPGRYLDKHLHRAPLALTQVRGGLSARLHDGLEARRIIGEWIAFYNAERQHAGRGLPRRPSGPGRPAPARGPGRSAESTFSTAPTAAGCLINHGSNTLARAPYCPTNRDHLKPNAGDNGAV